MTTKFKNIFGKTTVLMLAFAAFMPMMSVAQGKMEKTHTISKKAVKGYLYELSLNENGNIEAVYNIKSGKNSTVFEVYEFDKSLNLVGSKDMQDRMTRYTVKPAKTANYVYATVGGGSSFDILSTKLNLHYYTAEQTWDLERQRYNRKIVKRENIKPRNETGKKYNGRVSYSTDDGVLFVLALSDKGKSDKTKEYSLLKVDSDRNLTDIPISFDRQHVLIYSALIPVGKVDSDDDEEIMSNHDMLYVFAPETGNLTDYTCIQFSQEGKERFRFKMKVPKDIMAITAHRAMPDGTLYLCGLSTESKKPFSDLIGEYSPIVNASYAQYGTPNYQHEMYERNLEKISFSDFLTIKIKGDKLERINATPIADFKKKLQSPPNQKGGWAYDGKRFVISDFYVTPDENIIILGQRKVYVFKPEPRNIEWRDVVCMRIDNKGNLVAQFSYKPMTDKDSKLFPIPQALVPGKDGKSLYWVCYEVKATKGYASWYDAYSGTSTITGKYYPSVGKIDLSNNTIGNFEVMGNRKFLLGRRNLYVSLPDENARVYIAEDKKGKVMLAKYNFD